MLFAATQVILRSKVADTVKDHCIKMSNNAFILNNEYLRENTIIARYKDVALSPRKFAQKMETLDKVMIHFLQAKIQQRSFLIGGIQSQRKV